MLRARLEDFRGHRDRNGRGLFAWNAGDTDRAGNRCESGPWRTALLEPPFELPSLGERSDETAVREIISPQYPFANRFVERMAMRHDEKIAARRRHVDFRFDRVRANDRDICGNFSWEFVIACIDPRDLAVDIRK